MEREYFAETVEKCMRFERRNIFTPSGKILPGEIPRIFMSPPNPLPERIPEGDISLRVDRVNCRFAEAFFAVLDDRGELWQRHQLKRFDEILFLACARRAAVPSGARVRFLPMHSFADEVGGTLGTGPVGSLEYDSVAEV